MDTDQTTEYASAFAVGLLVGVGAALLFAPKPPTRKERLMKQIKPYRDKLEKGASSAKKQVGDRAAAAADWRDEMFDASRAVITDMKGEVAKMVADARKEIADAVADQLDSAQKSLKTSAKKLRS
jgi:gas vesicle protein